MSADVDIAIGETSLQKGKGQAKKTSGLPRRFASRNDGKEYIFPFIMSADVGAPDNHKVDKSGQHSKTSGLPVARALKIFHTSARTAFAKEKFPTHSLLACARSAHPFLSGGLT